MRQKIIIIGAGQNGKVVENILRLNPSYELAGFLDDHKIGVEILGSVADYKKFQDKNLFFLSLGYNQLRKKIFTELETAGVKFINAIHPTAVIEKNVVLGHNIMIGALTYININTQIGDNTIINNGCLIEHDNKIGKHCHITPGVITAGEVTIEDEAFIGIGSTIRDRITIGKNCLIGAHSNVAANTDPNSVYYGNPAKFIKPYAL